MHSEEVRHYIGMSGGMRGSMKTEGEHYDAPPFTPLGPDGQWTWYQVSPEIAEEWMRDGEEDPV